MKIFTCQKCQHVLFFENVRCTRCDQTLAYLPDQAIVSALEPEQGADAADPKRTVYVQIDRAQRKAAVRRRYRLCQNSIEHGVCNWAVPADSDDVLCRACGLNEVIPNLASAQAKLRWQRLEIAKRRLLYTLLGLELPSSPRADDRRGLAFAFKEDEAGARSRSSPATRGPDHDQRRRGRRPRSARSRASQMGEAYRTLLGHFRHEIGHYYWDRLVRDTAWLRRLSRAVRRRARGLRRAVQAPLREGAPADWRRQLRQRLRLDASVGGLGRDLGALPAHGRHARDGAQLRAGAPAEGVGGAPVDAVSARRLDFDDFEDLIARLVPLTLALNSLNRSMGLPDLYPVRAVRVGLEEAWVRARSGRER